MQVTVRHTTEMIGGREYPLTITRQVGRQEIEVEGRPVAVDVLTIFESPLGQSRSYTRAAETELGPEAREENCRKVREAAAQALISRGIW